MTADASSHPRRVFRLVFNHDESRAVTLDASNGLPKGIKSEFAYEWARDRYYSLDDATRDVLFRGPTLVHSVRVEGPLPSYAEATLLVLSLAKMSFTPNAIVDLPSGTPIGVVPMDGFRKWSDVPFLRTGALDSGPIRVWWKGKELSGDIELIVGTWASPDDAAGQAHLELHPETVQIRAQSIEQMVHVVEQHMQTLERICKRPVRIKRLILIGHGLPGQMELGYPSWPQWAWQTAIMQLLPYLPTTSVLPLNAGSVAAHSPALGRLRGYLAPDAEIQLGGCLVGLYEDLNRELSKVFPRHRVVSGSTIQYVGDIAAGRIRGLVLTCVNGTCSYDGPPPGFLERHSWFQALLALGVAEYLGIRTYSSLREGPARNGGRSW